MPINSDQSKGFALGIGIALLTPIAVTALLTVGRPAAKAAIKTGLMAYQKGREVVAEMGEVMEDLTAEAQAELDEARAADDESVEDYNFESEEIEVEKEVATAGVASEPTESEAKEA